MTIPVETRFTLMLKRTRIQTPQFTRLLARMLPRAFGHRLVCALCRWLVYAFGLVFVRALGRRCAVALLVALALVLLMPMEADAHRPLFAGTDAAQPQFAVRISNPTVSYVMYAELTALEPYRWFVFDNEKPQPIKFQLGTPSGSGWETTDPALGLSGPGLSEQPEALLVVPSQGQGVGVAVLPRLDEAQLFDEPVTGTTSRILIETEMMLPEAGTYYGVVYDRSGQGGKFWVGMGERERFSWRDVLRLPSWVLDIRRFHEVPGLPLWMWIATAVLAAGAAALGWALWRLVQRKAA